ncbi:MAG: glycosyltransferase [Gemmatimonadaceae bacterium]|nr:glycosyltransferase [Gemmatimonadaceae bacterium]
MADIAFFLPTLAGGGVERVVLNVICGFAARGHSIDLVLMRHEGELLEQVPAEIRIVDLRAPALGDALFITALPALTNYLRIRPPRVLFSAMTTVNLIALWARSLSRSPTKIVLSEHVPVSVNARTHPLKRVLPFLVRRNYAAADAIVAVSRALGDDLASVAELPRARIDTVYNPVVTPRLLRQSAERPDHPWFAEDVPIVVGIGRLVPQKDFETLLEAFAIARRRRRLRLVILGEGPGRAALEASITRLGLADEVRLLGFVGNPASYLGHASLFVLSSVFEGLAMVLIEALACGCPVVSTACPTGPDEILEDGVYGRLVPMRDAPAMAEAIIATLDAPPSRATAERRGLDFSLEAIIPQYVALFERVAASGRKSG